jgi:hypothetical protein
VKNDTKVFESLEELIAQEFHPELTRTDDQRAHLDAIVQRFEKIRALATGAIGQLILLVKRSEESSVCIMGDGSPRPEDYRIKESAMLGVLREPGIKWETYRQSFITTILTTKQYVWVELFSYEPISSIQQGPITDGGLASALWLHLDEPLECRNPSNQRQKPSMLELVAGNDAVSAWFARRHEDLVLRKACKMLDFDLQGDQIALAVVRKLHMLTETIEELWVERVPLKRRIDAILKAGRGGGGALASGGGLTVCETEEDARIITWRDQERLQAIDKRIRACFEEAKEYGGLANVPIVQHVAAKLNIPLV